MTALPPQHTSSSMPAKVRAERAAQSKLPRLPKNARVQKRPIIRPPIPSPYSNASQQKVVYISAHTPFISGVKRVRKLLAEADKRAVGDLSLLNGKGNDRQKLQRLNEKIDEAKSKPPEEVVLKASGAAIERVLGLGLYFQGQPDCTVRVRTGSVGVVDDIVEKERLEQPEAEGEEEMVEEQELAESRVRKISVVEVAVTLK